MFVLTKSRCKQWIILRQKFSCCTVSTDIYIGHISLIHFRSWRTDLPKGACVLVATSVEHPDTPLIGGVRGVTLASRYLIEPCGSGKSRVTHICRLDLRFVPTFNLLLTLMNFYGNNCCMILYCTVDLCSDKLPNIFLLFC